MNSLGFGCLWRSLGTRRIFLASLRSTGIGFLDQFCSPYSRSLIPVPCCDRWPLVSRHAPLVHPRRPFDPYEWSNARRSFGMPPRGSWNRDVGEPLLLVFISFFYIALECSSQWSPEVIPDVFWKSLSTLMRLQVKVWYSWLTQSRFNFSCCLCWYIFLMAVLCSSHLVGMHKSFINDCSISRKASASGLL